MSQYELLASYYDDLVKDEEATKDWADWIETFLKPCTMLDAACGSAELTLELAHRGYAMTGLDLSASMIEQAQKKIAKEKISFVCQDMTDLHGLPVYAGICCVCDSINYLIDDADVKRFFKEVHAHLQDGGLFFFDTHAVDRLEEFAEEYVETGHLEDTDYQWVISCEEDLIYQDFAFYLADGRIRQENYVQRVFAPEQLAAWLEPYFTIESIRTDFTEEGICPGEKYFYVCKRRTL